MTANILAGTIDLTLRHHDLASLLASKLQAIFNRPYVKGRDWYDLWWYLEEAEWPPPNFAYLNSNLTNMPLSDRKINEISSIAQLQHLACQGVTDWKPFGEVSTDQDGDLILFNYTPKAQYEGRWNFFERVSRGLILNRKTGEVVARPFDKFFNWGERGQISETFILSVMEKLDGSLGILYRQDNLFKIATRGAFHSEQAEWATHFLQTRYVLADLPDSLTLLFEIIYPDNRIIVNYGERSALVLLAARNRFTGEFLPFIPDGARLADQFGFPKPTVYAFSDVGQILPHLQTLDSDHEGFVATFADGQRFKFKGANYLLLHKLVYGLSFKATLTAIANGSVEAIRQQIPEEFLGEFNGWVDEIEQKVAAIKANIDALFQQAPKTSRKQFAGWVLSEHQGAASYLFALWDGKDIEPLIYRLAFRNRERE